MRLVNCRQAAARFAKAYYDDPGKQMKVIGITGTNGKTTTTTLTGEIMKAVIAEKGLK